MYTGDVLSKRGTVDSAANFFFKCLNKKRTVSLFAITENDKIHITPEEIVGCLQNDFSSRFTAQILNMNNPTDVLASKLWNELSVSGHIIT
jgi:hypothetical protein